MRPLKIALLSRWYGEENRRATTTHSPEGGMVQQLAEAVADLGHEVVVLSQGSEVRGLEKAQVGRLETWLSPRDRKRDFVTGLRDKWAKRTYRHRKVHSDALALRDFLARRGPFDLLWAQCEEPDGLVAAIAARSGIALPPTLTQIHSLRYRFENGTALFDEKPSLGLAFQHATRLIANSQLVADALPAYAGAALSAEQLAAKTRVVYPNLTRDFFRAAGEPNVPAPEPNRVLFLGALNEKKGALLFLEAILKANALLIGTFEVVGGFTEKNPGFLERWNKTVASVQAKLPPERFQLTGKVDAARVMQQIARAQVVVMPSLFDEFSRTAAEALILGRPVITTDRVGAAALVRDHEAGLVVPAGDADALAHAIDHALIPSSPYAENARHLGHRLVHELSPAAVARQLAHHFEEMTEKLTELRN